jgi:DNA topoisomerase-1
VATVVRLLDKGQIRVGNQEYARDNESFGLTTLREEHVDVLGSSTIRFRFRGKSGKEHDVSIQDRRLARVIAELEDLPGEELFTYVGEEGDVRAVESSDVNDYIREAAGGDFSAKDFRTWVGTVFAACKLRELGPPESDRHAKRLLKEAVNETAAYLGNTATICRKCYMHPVVVEAFGDRSLFTEQEAAGRSRPSSESSALSPEESSVLSLLREKDAEADARARKGAA